MSSPPPAGAVPGTCHLWMATCAGQAEWLRLLSPEDLTHIARQRTGPGRLTATLSRALQRLAVARYLGIDPEAVRLGRACPHCGSPAHGRPSVPGATFDLSVAHGGQMVVVAVVDRGRVGVDLEPADAVDAAAELAPTVLAPAELRAYGRVPGAARAAWLLRAWVRKEAVVKLTGTGLDVDPTRVDVRAARARMPGIGPVVHLHDLAVPGYVAALATTHLIREVVTRELDEPPPPGLDPPPPRAAAPTAPVRTADATRPRRP